jgi:RNA polymerase sigma factor (TIGR02999 family)
MPAASDITRLLQQADQGDLDAAGRLYALVEADLKAIAGKRRQGALGQLDLSTTMLVNDAFLKLVGQNVTAWQPGDRRKFFGLMAVKMHDLLIDAARQVQAHKRGGDRQRLELDEQGPPAAAAATPELLLDLKEALDRFAKFAQEDALVFRLRTFLGCTFTEVAEIVDFSETKAKASFQRAQAWLRRELKDYRHDA